MILPIFPPERRERDYRAPGGRTGYARAIRRTRLRTRNVDRYPDRAVRRVTPERVSPAIRIVGQTLRTDNAKKHGRFTLSVSRKPTGRLNESPRC